MSAALLTAAIAASIAGATPEIRFRDAAAPWGVDVRHHHTGSGEYFMPETMGAGVVIFDADGDGDADLLFVDSTPLPGYTGEPPRTRFLRNDLGGHEPGKAGGRPHFVDRTDVSGIALRTYGMGGAAGDLDGDGDLDLVVTGFGPTQVFRNRGDGTFADTTEAAGLGAPGWSTAAALADADRDGDLDLYVAHYVDFALDRNVVCGVRERGLRSYCHPDVYPGLPDRYYENRGDGTFVEATAAAGLLPEHVRRRPGKGLGAVFADLDDDGAPDLYVANDMTPNFHFRNRGDGTFEEMALLSNTAVSDLGLEEAGMGIAVGDADGDGRDDLLVTHLDLQTNALYGNLGDNLFADRRFASGLAEPSLYRVGFGAAFGDLDLDGDLDLAVANGHIIDNIERWGTGGSFRQPDQVFANRGDGRFFEVDAGLGEPRASRGLAAGDLDRDGDLDLVVTASDDRAAVWENVGRRGGAWLELELRMARGEAQGVGSRAVATAAGRSATRQLLAGGSYLSQHDLTLHFGTGEAARADLALRLRDGRRLRLRELPTGRRYRLAVGQGGADPVG